jgi:hypothetical protein
MSVNGNADLAIGLPGLVETPQEGQGEVSSLVSSGVVREGARGRFLIDDEACRVTVTICNKKGPRDRDPCEVAVRATCRELYLPPSPKSTRANLEHGQHQNDACDPKDIHQLVILLRAGRKPLLEL